MSVRSLAVLLPGLASPPPATTATLVTLDGALASTFTVSVIRSEEGRVGITAEFVQVSVASVHVQPVPDRLVAVKPDGSASTTVTAPLVGPAPTLLTMIV